MLKWERILIKKHTRTLLEKLDTEFDNKCTICLSELTENPSKDFIDTKEKIEKI